MLKRSPARVLLYLVFLLVTGSVAAELLVRLLEVGPELQRYHWIVEDSVLPYRSRPQFIFSGRNWSDEYNFEHRGNSLGYRDVEHSLVKPIGTFRILGIGDSFTVGWGARQEESYLYLAEKWLNKREGNHPSVEIIKAGMAGYSPEAEVLLLEHEGLHFDPDLVVVGATANEIIDTYHGLEAVRRAGLFSVDLITAAGLSEMEFGLYRWWRTARMPLRRLARLRVEDRLYDDLLVDLESSEVWENMISSYYRLVLLARCSEAKVVLLFMPDLNHPDFEPLVSRLRRWSEQNGVVFLDTRSALDEARASGAEFMWPVDNHPTAAGYRVIGRVLFDGLLEHHLVP